MNNILIITDYAAPYEGNFIESIKILNKNIIEKNKKIVYLFPARTKKLKWIQKLIDKEKFTIYFFKDDTFFNIKNVIKDIIKKENIEILYTHFCRHKTQLAVKTVRTFKPKIKLISHFHNHCKVYGNIVKRNFMKIAYKLYEGDLNIGCSKSVYESMPYKRKKCTFVDNAINFERLDKYRDIKIEKTDENSFIILLFGFDYHRKGADLAIKAIKEINNPNIILAISVASNKEKIIKYIVEEFGFIPGFVRFLEPINDIATYYRKADLFLSAAREEGFCYSIVEAAYCKTAILSSNIPGVPKDIPGEYIFETENYTDLKNKILEIYNLKDIDKEVARHYVKEKYDIDRWANRIVQKIYEGERICHEKKSSI